MEMESEMEMPCVCNCGEIFDLNDGYGSTKDNSVVCINCHKKQERVKELEFEIMALESEGNKKRQIKKLQKEIDSIV